MESLKHQKFKKFINEVNVMLLRSSSFQEFKEKIRIYLNFAKKLFKKYIFKTLTNIIFIYNIRHLITNLLIMLKMKETFNI